MKRKTKLIIVIVLSLIAIGLIIAIFVTQYKMPIVTNESSEDLFTKNIIEPDRIVYRDKNGQYYQFLKDTEQYNQIKETIKGK